MEVFFDPNNVGMVEWFFLWERKTEWYIIKNPV